VTRMKKRGVAGVDRSVQEAWTDRDVVQASMLDARPVLITKGTGEGVELWLELDLELVVEGAPYGLAVAALVEYVDPYVLAGELMGLADSIVQQVALDRGADEREAGKLLRSQHLKQRRRRREVAEQVAASGATHCDFCQRGVAFVVEGSRLCKRHAEELGLRPHGKIGNDFYEYQAPDDQGEE
jgi:hypothetical protein